MSNKKFKNKHNENLNKEQLQHNCECNHCKSENCECGCKEGKECHCGNDCKCQHKEADCGEGIKCAPEGCEVENDKIENLKSEISSWQERYLRTMADCENTKRRAEIDAKNMVDYKISKFAKDMLPLADNLSLAIASMEGKVDENILNGLKSIQNSFISALEKNGICKIPTVGNPLNPTEHCVVMQVDDPNIEEGAIARELQAGYKLGDKVIREAMVATANKSKNNYATGVEAENKAKEILQTLNFSILSSRYQVGYGLEAGEIDIIATNPEKKLLLFIEVKKRKTLSLAAESIKPSQMNRIYASAEIFLSQNQEFENFDCRFDAILFDENFNYEYIENAWGL